MIGIYKITNTVNGKCYIGQSIHIETRWEEHQRNAANPNRPHYKYPINCAFSKYGIDKFDFEVLEECSEKELNEKEIKWIKFYDSFEHGYNLSMGGGGLRKYDIDAIIKDYQKTNNLRQTAKNFNCHPATVRNIAHSVGLYGEEAEMRPIEQIDPKTMAKIHTYESVISASNATGLSTTAIRKALSGQHSHSGGYYWRDKGDTTKIFQPITRVWKKQVVQLDKESGEEIARYSSTADAARALGKDGKNGGSQIGRVCRGGKPTAFGFKWKYEE